MNDSLSTDIQQLCVQMKWTLSVAESCTGGDISARLTRLPGSSQYFLGSIVAYSNLLKNKLLGVENDLLKDYGSVSGPVVCQMAKGILQLTGSDYSLAVSGVAGPNGGTSEKPIGTIWGAICCKKEEIKVWNFHVSGNRQKIIEKSTEILLTELWLLIKSEKRIIK